MGDSFAHEERRLDEMRGILSRDYSGEEEMTSLAAIRADLKNGSSVRDATFLQRFFKTGAGEYGEGDRFRGIRVPALRSIARTHADASIATSSSLLSSMYHEDRMLALLILMRQYERGDARLRERIFRLYLANTHRINNWDLVDLSAGPIVGAHIATGSRVILAELAQSPGLWERRIAMLATFHFIKKGEFTDTLKIAAILLGDREDLMHKAVGWMLREVGKRDGEAERRFLAKHYHEMPRTMLRYAIEKFPEAERQVWLEGSLPARP